jgi:hypothetical protein
MHFDKYSKQYYVVSLRHLSFFFGKHKGLNSIKLVNLVF